MPIRGGYDYSFVHATPDRLVCMICHHPSRDPHLTECCGVIYCKSCLDQVKQSTKVSTACPHCRAKSFNSILNKQAVREIKSLHIYCTNKEKGCEWQGELNDINNHLENSDGCQFEEVKCSNECGRMIKRLHLESHVEMGCPHRDVQCEYCYRIGAYQFIKGQHKEDCPKLPQSCPYRCGVGDMPRDELHEHTKVCSLQEIPCEYHNVGCKAIIARKDQENHNDEKRYEHQRLLLQELQDSRRELQGSRREIKQLQDSQLMSYVLMIGLAGIGLFVTAVRNLK